LEGILSQGISSTFVLMTECTSRDGFVHSDLFQNELSGLTGIIASPLRTTSLKRIGQVSGQPLAKKAHSSSRPLARGVSPEPICAVCWKPAPRGAPGVVVTLCGHSFHLGDCLAPALFADPEARCPVCRTPQGWAVSVGMAVRTFDLISSDAIEPEHTRAAAGRSRLHAGTQSDEIEASVQLPGGGEEGGACQFCGCRDFYLEAADSCMYCAAHEVR